MNRALWSTFLLAALASLVPAFAQQSGQAFTLEDCIRTALAHNPQLVSSAQDIAVARNSLRQARSSYSPQLGLSASEGLHGSRGRNNATDNGASLTLDMTFWRTGRQDSVAQSKANVASALSSHGDTRLGVAQLVADDYYAVLAASELVGVAKAGVEYAEQHRAQVATQIEKGSVAAVEIHTVDDDLAQARLSLIEARSTMRTAMATLKTDMGLPYTTDLQLAPALMGTEQNVPAEADAVATALAKRPDLQAQRATVQARRSAVRVARAARGPVLEVSGQAAQDYADWDDTNSSWDLTAGLTWPLADGGYTAAAQRTAEANLTASEASLQNLSNEAALAVQTALIELERTTESIKACEEALTAATARLKAAEVKYSEGLGILIEVTSARQDLTGAEADLVRARFDYQTAVIALQREMGTLPLPEAEDQP